MKAKQQKKIFNLWIDSALHAHMNELSVILAMAVQTEQPKQMQILIAHIMCMSNIW